jgi:polyisoprenoid-binding protein YceI
MKYSILALIFLLALQVYVSAQSMFEIRNGAVKFESNAPLENIKASSTELTGLVDIAANSFAFSIDVISFKGFNSPLQQEHFYENYMETTLYPKATFSGKLIDKFNPDIAKQKLRAKGNLTVHGVKKERIIDVMLTKKGSLYLLDCNFNVLLVDHAIRIPKVVHQKIAENISISVKGDMVAKK